MKKFKIRVCLLESLTFADGSSISEGTEGWANQLDAFSCNATFDGHTHGVLCLTAWLKRINPPRQLPLFEGDLR